MIEKRGNSFREPGSPRNNGNLQRLIPPREKFNMTKLINEKCLEESFAPDDKGKCRPGQTEICVQDEETKNWKMITCKMDGVINPQTGLCDCERKKFSRKQHKRTTRNLKRSNRRPNRYSPIYPVICYVENSTENPSNRKNFKNQNFEIFFLGQDSC